MGPFFIAQMKVQSTECLACWFTVFPHRDPTRESERRRSHRNFHKKATTVKGSPSHPLHSNHPNHWSCHIFFSIPEDKFSLCINSSWKSIIGGWLLCWFGWAPGSLQRKMYLSWIRFLSDFKIGYPFEQWLWLSISKSILLTDTSYQFGHVWSWLSEKQKPNLCKTRSLCWSSTWHLFLVFAFAFPHSRADEARKQAAESLGRKQTAVASDCEFRVPGTWANPFDRDERSWRYECGDDERFPQNAGKQNKFKSQKNEKNEVLTTKNVAKKYWQKPHPLGFLMNRGASMKSRLVRRDSMRGLSCSLQ